MNRRSIVARILMLDGILLLVVAVIHFAATGLVTRWLTNRLTPDEYLDIGPPFLLNHLTVGILLIPLALTTFYSAWGVKKGQHWSRVVSMINGVCVLALPVLLAWLMGAQYYSSIPFLLASILIVVIGITMLVPLVWFPKDSVERIEHAGSNQNLPA
jgi:hypothetical protein